MKKLNVAEKLESLQKRCSVRIISEESIKQILQEYTEKLGISKKALLGSEVVDCDINAQNFPNAYRYTPESTHFSAIYKTTGWVVTNIWRDRCNTANNRLYCRLSETAKEAIIKNLSSF